MAIRKAIYVFKLKIKWTSFIFVNYNWSELTFYRVWIDLLYFGYYLLYTVYDSTREWIYCILGIVHILKQTVQLCKLSEYLYIDIL